MFEYWRLALKGKAPSLSAAEADIGKCGYWRTKDGAIAIWVHIGKDGHSVDDKVFHAINHGKIVMSHGLPEIRGFAFALPVSYDDYIYWLTYSVWPGQVPGLGHNTSQISSFQEWQENIKGQIEDALRWLRFTGNISTQTDADTAANYRDAINKLVKKGEVLQKEERDPLDAQIKEIRKRWGMPLDQAGEAIKTLRGAVGTFLKAESTREELRVQKENERLAKERRDLEDRDITLAALEEPVKEVRPEKVGAGGQLGRKTGLREVYKPVITDYNLVLEFFRDSDAVRETIQKLCSAEARSKTRRIVPGLEYVKSKEAI